MRISSYGRTVSTVDGLGAPWYYFPSTCGIGSPSDTEQSQYSTGTELFQLINKGKSKYLVLFFLPTKQETYQHLGCSLS